MPDDLFGVVVAGESGLFEHLAEDEVSILSQYVRVKSAAMDRKSKTLLSMVNPLATARGSNLGSIARASGNCVMIGSWVIAKTYEVGSGSESFRMYLIAERHELDNNKNRRVSLTPNAWIT